jgi:rfaE bifunctional protein nucleotidyltransferase chain/domain
VSREKIKTKEELRPIIEDLRRAGKRVVFTNGWFYHKNIGHVRYLREARARGDVLVVALNTDRSIRALKGWRRPILREDERTRIIAAFEMVDFVTMFDELDPQEIIAYLRPQVLIKGGDYRIDEIVGREVVWAEGGEVAAVPLVQGASTSEVIEEILRRFAPQAESKNRKSDRNITK